MSINTITCLKVPCNRQSFTLAHASASANGVLLRVHHTIVMPHGNVNQRIRFLHASFNSTGEALAASNHLGNVYVFDFVVSKYWLLVHVNCSIIKFNTGGDEAAKDQLLVGTTAGDIRVYNSHSGRHLADLLGHTHPVTDISFSDASECVTLGNNQAILWNLANYCKLQVLQLEEGAILKFVMFIPVSNDVIACFTDETVQIWKANTFEPLKQISSNVNESFNKLSIRSITFTSNGQLMAIVGHAPTIFIFQVDTLQLKKECTFTEMHFTIRKAQFLPNLFDDGVNKILSFLTSSGSIYFYNMEFEVFISKITMDEEIWKYSVDPTSNRIATICKSGELQMHSLGHVLTKLHRGKVLKTIIAPSKQTGKAKCKVSKKVSNDAIKKQLSDVLDTNKLKAILREFGEYPTMYRKIIWKHLLQLPNNDNQYAALSSMVLENAFYEYDKLYALDIRQDMKSLKRFSQNLVAWCPFLSAVSYLPVLIFPIVKFLQTEPVLCLETLVTFIVNYCQYWFEYHPVPPLNILGLVESIIIQQDANLMEHFNKKGVTSKTYSWFILQSMFSEVLSSSQWLIFMDHLITNNAVFMILAVAAFSLVNKTVLMTLDNTEDFEFFYRTNSTTDFKRFLARCYKLLNDKTMEHHPRLYMKPFEPIESGEYPVFDQYPKNCLQVCQNINTLRSEVNSLKREGDLMDTNVMELKKLKELEKSSEEYFRQTELNKLYSDKLEEEKMNVRQHRKRLESLRLQVQEKERGLNASSQQILQSFVSDGKTLTESNSDSVRGHEQYNKVEENLLKHYTNLLKHKIQIEGLIDDDVSLDFIQLKRSYKEISDEINRTQARMAVPSQEYLKQLNVVTGLAAVNSLIHKVETKISERSTTKDRSKTRYIVAKLATESEELSHEINKLMTLLAETK